MNRCEDVLVALPLYVDGELPARDEIGVEAHLLECSSCRATYEELRSVVDVVRGSKPLYDPPPSLRPSLESLVRGSAGRRISTGAAIAAGLVLLLLGMPMASRGVSFESFATDAHVRYANGRLPLDVTSDDQLKVSDWLKAHMPFVLELPEYPNDNSEPKAYTLAGARLMQYGGGDAAYLAYMMRGRPVSLLVTSGDEVKPSGHEVLRSGKLLFHFSVRNGLKVITWRDRDLVYALVSDVRVSNAESCVVCHGSKTERSRFDHISTRIH